MPIYVRGKSFMVSVGSRDDRFRQSYKTRHEAEAAEKAALSRLKASGSPLEASQRHDQKGAGTHLLGDLYKLTWSLRWKHDKHPETHDFHTRVLFRTIDPRTPVDEIDLEMIEEAVLEWDDDEASNGTINRRLQHLNTMLKMAFERGWIMKVPKMPKRKENKHRIRWMTDAEEAKVTAMAHKLGYVDLRDFIVVACDTGFRRGELLSFESADFFNGQLHLHHGSTKNDDARSVPATDRVRAILQSRSHLQHPFGMLSPQTLRRQWLKLKSALGYDKDEQFVVHMLRHTCASRLVQRGVPLAVVQQWMGHKEIQTTMRYAHLGPDSLMNALKVLNESTGQVQLKVVNQ